MIESRPTDRPPTCSCIKCLLLAVLPPPSVTTFCLPSQLMPKERASSLNGVAAACGKVGAVVGAVGLAIVSSAYGIAATMAVCAATAVCAVATTCTLLPSAT